MKVEQEVSLFLRSMYQSKYQDKVPQLSENKCSFFQRAKGRKYGREKKKFTQLIQDTDILLTKKKLSVSKLSLLCCSAFTELHGCPALAGVSLSALIGQRKLETQVTCLTSSHPRNSPTTAMQCLQNIQEMPDKLSPRFFQNKRESLKTFYYP